MGRERLPGYVYRRQGCHVPRVLRLRGGREAQYDTAALSVALGEGYRPASGSLGPQTENPDFGKDRGLQLNRVLDNPFFLGGVICLMLIVLALILFRAGRRIEGLTKE